MVPKTFLQRPIHMRKHSKMHGLLGCHHRRLRLMPLFWITAILATTVNAFTFSDQQNHIHLSLQYNQRSPTWARISQDLNSFPRPRRSVADQDELRKDEVGAKSFASGQESTGILSLRRIRSTPKSPSLANENQTESKVLDRLENPSKIQIEKGKNDTGTVTESQRSEGKRELEEKDLLASVAQQVSKIVHHKLLPAEGGQGKSHKKSHKSAHGGKGGKGHKSFHGHKSGKKGHHSEAGKKGFFDKGGDSKHGHHRQKNFHGSYKGGTKAAKGHKEGFNEEHRKGHRDKGFKNLHHKKEYGFKKNFHDADAFFKHFANQDFFKDFFKGGKGGAKKHSNHKGHKSHSDHGKKGFFDKGHFHVDDHGNKKQYGIRGYHGHRSSHGHKDGHEGSH